MKITLLAIILLVCTQVNGQQYTDKPPQKEEKEIKSLLNSDNQITGFGNLDFRMSSIKDKETLIIGGYGGLIINRNIMLGVAGYGLASNVDFDGVIPSTTTNKTLNMYGGYGGFVLGIMVASKEVIHLSFPIILAAGNLDIVDNNYLVGLGDNSYTVESSKFFVIEPTVQLELNISKTFRIGLGGGYRLVKALELDNVTDDEMSNFSGVFSVKFGGF